MGTALVEDPYARGEKSKDGGTKRLRVDEDSETAGNRNTGQARGREHSLRNNNSNHGINNIIVEDNNQNNTNRIKDRSIGNNTSFGASIHNSHQRNEIASNQNSNMNASF